MGVIAFSRQGDPETGDYENAVVLSRWARFPTMIRRKCRGLVNEFRLAHVALAHDAAADRPVDARLAEVSRRLVLAQLPLALRMADQRLDDRLGLAMRRHVVKHDVRVALDRLVRVDPGHVAGLVGGTIDSPTISIP